RVGDLAIRATLGHERDDVELTGSKTVPIRGRGHRTGDRAQIEARPARQACDRVAYTDQADVGRARVRITSARRRGVAVVVAHERLGRAEARVGFTRAHA